MANYTLKTILFCLTIGLLAACQPAPPPKGTPVVLTEGRISSLPPINSISIEGPFNIHVVNGGSDYKVLVQGDPKQLQHVSAMVVDHKLVIKPPQNYGDNPAKGQLSFTIFAPRVAKVYAHDTNQIYLDRTDFPELAITADSGTIHQNNAFGEKLEYDLGGKANFQGNCINTKDVTINASGHSQVNLQCVTVRHLVLNGLGAAHFKLTGQANRLDVNLQGNSLLQSQQFTAGLANINTQQKSEASIDQVNIGVVNVDSDDNAHILLTGEMNKLNTKLAGSSQLIVHHTHLKTLETSSAGHSRVELNDMHFNKYIVNEKDQSSVRVSGLSQRVDATLKGDSTLDTLCLKSRTLFIDTTDNASARVINYFGLSALASKHSNIYYYQDPKMVAEYLRTSGSVMRMVGLETTHCHYPESPMIK